MDDAVDERAALRVVGARGREIESSPGVEGLCKRRRLPHGGRQLDPATVGRVIWLEDDVEIEVAPWMILSAVIDTPGDQVPVSGIALTYIIRADEKSARAVRVRLENSSVQLAPVSLVE